MTIEGFYELKGPGVKITYRRSASELDVEFDADSPHSSLSRDNLETSVAVEAEIGELVTAVLLPSSRNGTQIILTLLLPQANWSPRRTPELANVTGVAIVTETYANLVGGPPPVLQSYGTVIPVEGSALSFTAG